MYLIYFEFFIICSVDVKKRRKKEKYSESECVVFFNEFFYDKIVKNKEEFNILICSRSRIMNLHINRISNIK
jgi:hypothetical protein